MDTRNVGLAGTHKRMAHIYQTYTPGTKYTYIVQPWYNIKVHLIIFNINNRSWYLYMFVTEMRSCWILIWRVNSSNDIDVWYMWNGSASASVLSLCRLCTYVVPFVRTHIWRGGFCLTFEWEQPSNSVWPAYEYVRIYVYLYYFRNLSVTTHIYIICMSDIITKCGVKEELYVCMHWLNLTFFTSDQFEPSNLRFLKCKYFHLLPARMHVFLYGHVTGTYSQQSRRGNKVLHPFRDKHARHVP